MKKRCIAWMLIVAMSINGMTALAVEKAESKDNSVSASYVKTAVYEDGWYHDNTSNSWYYYEDGEYVTGWEKVDGYWYYFNASGVMQKGWKKVDGYWYYFNQNGCMITGWKNVDGYWYYFNQNGCMITGWKNVEGYWYYFNQNGCMITGWKNVDGYWYYFNQNGCMITGWKNVDGYWYYFNKAGVMQIGWEKVDGYWYYFNKAGVMQTSRWIDNTYYVNSNGVMLTNTVTPDGYCVDNNGKFVVIELNDFLYDDTLTRLSKVLGNKQIRKNSSYKEYITDDNYTIGILEDKPSKYQPGEIDVYYQITDILNDGNKSILLHNVMVGDDYDKVVRKFSEHNIFRYNGDNKIVNGQCEFMSGNATIIHANFQNGKLKSYKYETRYTS